MKPSGDICRQQDRDVHSRAFSYQAPVFGKLCVSSGTAGDMYNLPFWKFCEKNIFCFGGLEGFILFGLLLVGFVCLCGFCWFCFVVFGLLDFLLLFCCLVLINGLKEHQLMSWSPRKNPKANLFFHFLPLVEVPSSLLKENGLYKAVASSFQKDQLQPNKKNFGPHLCINHEKCTLFCYY